jgi:hypothetical protein
MHCAPFYPSNWMASLLTRRVCVSQSRIEDFLGEHCEPAHLGGPRIGLRPQEIAVKKALLVAAVAADSITAKFGGGRVLTALVLICSAVVAADNHDCTRESANTVMRVPGEFGNPATCFMHAQGYLAGSSIGRDLDTNEQVRIICVPRESIFASTPRQ